jgi:hypothetical protein
VSSITLPSFGRVPGGTISTAPRSFVAACSAWASGAASDGSVASARRVVA